jgi:hypothetical protein
MGASTAGLANVAVARGDKRPGYVYRDRPVAGWDTGWRFFVGDEDGAFLADPNNSVVVGVDAIVARHPELRALLDASPGTVFERDAEGWFVDVTGRD